METIQKERNYTIEFVRIMFAVNFIIVHVLMVFPIGFLRGFPLFLAGLDTIIPFMAFAGFFMMQGFKKQQAAAERYGLSPGHQAGNYLKARLIGLLPVFLLAQLMGFFANNIWLDTPISQWPIRLLNAIGELTGVQITGIGFGNASVGVWGEGIRVHQLFNTPLWFISGIFVAGYIIYYLLAKNEKSFIGIIAPVSILIFYGSQYLDGRNPMWFEIGRIGDFNIPLGFIHMFVGLSIGCLIYVAVDKLKGKEFSRGMIAFMTIAQIILMTIVIVRTWAPVTSPIAQYFNMGWGSVHVLTFFFSFFVLLNVDKCTRFPLFSGRIWRIPGRMAFYMYMLHFPIIVFCAMLMGFKGTLLTPQTVSTVAPRLTILLVVTIVTTIILAYIVMTIDMKVLQPWLKSQPWFRKEQSEISTEA